MIECCFTAVSVGSVTQEEVESRVQAYCGDRVLCPREGKPVVLLCYN